MKLIFGAFEGCKIEIIAKPCREEENIFTSKKRRKVIPSFFFVSLAAFFWFYNKCWGSEAERPSYTQHFSLLGKKSRA